MQQALPTVTKLGIACTSTTRIINNHVGVQPQIQFIPTLQSINTTIHLSVVPAWIELVLSEDTTEPSKFASSEKPFGTLPGYRTTEGVVQVPRNPTQGYIYCLKTRKWLLHASPNSVGGRPVGRGCPGTRREEKERGKKPHSLL